MPNQKFSMRNNLFLPELQQLIQDRENLIYTFLFNSIIDPDFPNLNVAVYADKPAPSGKVYLIHTAPIPSGSQEVWNGNMFVQTHPVSITAYRQ